MAGDEDVFCTLVMNDAYLPGAAVLAHSLRDCGSRKKLACLILQDNLSASSVSELQSLFNYVIPIERIGNPTPANLYLMNRPDLLYTFTKINLWRLTQFRKIVYIDADIVVLRAPEELFDIQEPFAAAPDVGWPDAFNTGVMVISPHVGDYHAMRNMAQAGDSFDGADQGLINQYFEHRPWKRISFTYNTTPSANYQYEPAYRYYKRDISMVHFIGAEKPWVRGRSVSGASGAFQEMLSRWWAVYDRHFNVSTSDHVNGTKQTVQEYVNDSQARHRQHQHHHHNHHQAQSTSNNYYATGYPIESTRPAPPPQNFHRKSENDTNQQYEPAPYYPMPIGAPSGGTSTPPMTEPGEQAENIDQGFIQPAPTGEQRRFSAPHMEWDATRAAPPVSSRPEAANFPTQLYEFNSDPEPFRPPHQYPEPPKDMWYQVPEKPKVEEKLKPIFPWEEREVPQPTRRFLDDPSSPPPLRPTEDSDPFADELEVSTDRNEFPVTPTIQVTNSNPWEAFAQSKNAWDEDTRINSYVRALTAHQKTRGKVQVLSAETPEGQPGAGILSPSAIPDSEDLVARVEQRRESLLLTDFPSATERPSLPVTPAPIRRGNFWGEDRDDDGRLPVAEGVPEQSEWNQNATLENLRRSSLLAADLKLPQRKTIPERQMPSTAAPIPEELLADDHVPPSASLSPHVDKDRLTDPETPTPISGVDGQHDSNTASAAENAPATKPNDTSKTSAYAPHDESSGEPPGEPRSVLTNAAPIPVHHAVHDLLFSPEATEANTAFNKATTSQAAQAIFSQPDFHQPFEINDQALSDRYNGVDGVEPSDVVSPTTLDPNVPKPKAHFEEPVETPAVTSPLTPVPKENPLKTANGV